MIRTRPKISFDEPIYKNLKQRNWAPRKRANLVQGKKKANPIGLSVQVTTVAGKKPEFLKKQRIQEKKYQADLREE